MLPDVPPAPKPTPPGRVLVVDDDPLFLRVCSTILRRGGLSVDSAGSTPEALERLRATRYDTIVSDIRMPNGDGLSLLKAARQQDASVPFVLMTGAPTVESAISAIDGGVTKYLQKPFEVDHFRSVVEEAIARRLAAADEPSLNCRLDRAMEKLWMAYQPIVSAQAQGILAYEALLRTSMPDFAGPQEVIELAERTNRIFEVGRAIRARVTEDIEALDESVLVFVNLHPHDLEDEELYSLDSPLAAHAKRVVLEITERASVSHATALEEKMRQLRTMGYRIAVDDLGAGYAGLTTFARVRPEFVKLDASLVRSVDSAQGQQVVVATVLQMANALGSRVVAEAIETEGERAALTALGIDVMQGYFFAKPAPPFVQIDLKALAKAA